MKSAVFHRHSRGCMIRSTFNKNILFDETIEQDIFADYAHCFSSSAFFYYR